MWGMLNVKYLTSAQELNISGFSFEKKFEEYEDAWPDNSDGPYLYTNDEFMPRAMFIPQAILILGDYNSKKQTMYG